MVAYRTKTTIAELVDKLPTQRIPLAHLPTLPIDIPQNRRIRIALKIRLDILFLPLLDRRIARNLQRNRTVRLRNRLDLLARATLPIRTRHNLDQTHLFSPVWWAGAGRRPPSLSCCKSKAPVNSDSPYRSRPQPASQPESEPLPLGRDSLSRSEPTASRTCSSSDDKSSPDEGKKEN